MDKVTKFSIVGLAILLTLCFGFVMFVNYQKNVDRLFAKFEYQLKNKEFKSMYAQSSDFIKVRMTEHEFVEKMHNILNKLKQIDPNLKFTRDKSWENTHPEGFWEEQELIVTTQNIKKDEDLSAFVHIYWNDSGWFPNFENISVGQSTDENSNWSEKLEFKGFQERTK